MREQRITRRDEFIRREREFTVDYQVFKLEMITLSRIYLRRGH